MGNSETKNVYSDVQSVSLWSKRLRWLVNLIEFVRIFNPNSLTARLIDGKENFCDFVTERSHNLLDMIRSCFDLGALMRLEP